MGLSDEQKEELGRKVKEEQVRQTQKRLSTKASLTILILLIYGFSWGEMWREMRGGSVIQTILYIAGTAVVGLIMAIWVYRDARRRPMRAFAWAVLTFFLMPAALVLYLLETQSEPPVPKIQ